MSYLFDGTNDSLTGTFTTARASVPMTVAAWVKYTTHPLAQDAIVELGSTAASHNDAVYLAVGSTLNTFSGIKYNSTGTASTTDTPAVDYDGVWVPAVYVVTSATLRDVYAGTIGNTAQATLSRTTADLTLITIGENMVAGQDFTGRIAEVAVWNSALSTDDITAFLAGTLASGISAANLVGYWPLDYDNATQSNEGVDTGGDLTVATATYSTDHPPVSSGGVAKFMNQYRQRWA